MTESELVADPKTARDYLVIAVAQWRDGQYYDAHETLEEAAEPLDGVDHDIALSLVRVAACLHKLTEDVGRRAVPSKLANALGPLRTHVGPWFGVYLEGLLADLERLLVEIEPLNKGSGLGKMPLLPVPNFVDGF